MSWAGCKAWIKKSLLYPLLYWFVKRFVNRVRFWGENDWSQHTDLEKAYLWYKHQLMLRGFGSAEIDLFVMPVKELILYGGIILSNVLVALMYLGIELNYFYILSLVGMCCVVLWIANFVLQWKLGNWKDAKDLNALDTELGNRRNKLFRLLRQQAMQEPFRKELAKQKH